MALSDKDIVIAVRVVPKSSGDKSDDAVLRLANMNGQKFPMRTVSLLSTRKGHGYFEIDPTKHEWSNYFLSGLKGVLQALNVEEPVSIDCLVDGSVPTGAGVSSSSAFVCCSALAAAKVYNAQLSKKQLTEIAIVSERFVGVQTGGMDQSCSILGIRNAALMIHFYPKLDFDAVPIPAALTESEQPVFVVAHSLVTSDKHVTAPFCYNLRVVETRLAAAILAKLALGENSGQLSNLRAFQESYMEQRHKKQSSENTVVEGLKIMLELIETYLEKKNGYTLDEIAAILCISIDDLRAKYIGTISIKADIFHLYRRSKHVFSEALRVYQFKSLCDNSKLSQNSISVFHELGAIMNQSQESCKDLFDCSCPELDQLCNIARENGALGSRLTGAGWGGCTVSLVPRGKLETFLAAIKTKYYQEARGFSSENYDEVLFFSQPGRGAVYVSANAAAATD